MNDTHEPLAAILAEMRDLADHRAADAGGERPAIELLRSYADRIEAAAERERAGTIYAGRNGEMTLDECIVRCDNNSGDNPRGRDVAQIGGWLRELRERRNAPGNAAEMREALHKISETIWSKIDPTCKDDCCKPWRELAKIADAALAAPARNCDRCEFWEDLWGLEFVKLWPDVTDDLQRAWLFVRWLFAPAKGGAKCVNGLRGEPDCRGCNEHCEDVRKRNCFYWNPDIEGGLCALTGKKSCPISCDNFHIPEKVSPPPAEGGAE